MATLTDVARLAGVSLATASRVLNGSSRRVQQEYTDRVLVAAEQLRYHPDRTAQTMARGKSQVIGLVVSDITDPYYTGIASGVSSAAAEADGILSLATAGRDVQRRVEIIDLMHSYRAQALVLAGGMLLDLDGLTRVRVALTDLRDQVGTGVVSIGQPGLGVPTVTIPNAAAAGDLASQLLGKGFRRFGIVCGPELQYTSSERAHGFREVVQSAGADVIQVFGGTLDRAGGYAAMEALLDQDVELVFAVTDMMALGVLARLREAGMRVPEDIAVAGFGDIPILADVTPAVSTVRIDLVALGRLAVELCLNPPHPDTRVEANYQIFLRESTERR